MLKQNTKETLIREPTLQTALKRSIIPFYINSAVLVILCLIIIGIAFIATALLGNVFSILTLFINTGTTLVVFLILILVLSYNYLNYKSVNYVLIPGSIEKTELETMDQIPGKVLVKEGFFHRTKILLPMNEYDKVRIEKSFIGRMFDYGNLFLLQKDELELTQTYILMNIEKPEVAANYVQKMIDVEIRKLTPMMTNSKE